MKKNRNFANSFSELSNSRTLELSNSRTKPTTLKKALCMGVFLCTTLFSGFNASAQGRLGTTRKLHQPNRFYWKHQ
jgi:hypothetical protein